MTEEILFIQVPPWQVDTPPMGLAYLVEFLKENNIKSKVLDFNIELYNSCEDFSFWSIKLNGLDSYENLSKKFISYFDDKITELVTRIININIPIVGFSSTIMGSYLAEYIAKKVLERDPNKILILGGPCTSYSKFNSKKNSIFDAIFYGEGEIITYKFILTYRKILNSLKTKKESNYSGDINTKQRILSHFPRLPSISIKKKDGYSEPLPKEITNLSSIFFPKYSEFDINMYKLTCNFMQIQASRGCINKCYYCTDWKFNLPYRMKSAELIFKEILYHYTHNNIRKFLFVDLLINGNLKILNKLCDYLIEHKLNIEWRSYAIIRKGMTQELMNKLKLSGCTYLCYGVESFSEKVLKRNNKNYSYEDIVEVIKNTSNANIKVGINLIVGLPGETKKEFKFTLDAIKKNSDYINIIENLSSFVIIPGSEIDKRFNEFGIVKNLKDNALFNIQGESTSYKRAMRLKKILNDMYKNNIPVDIINLSNKYESNIHKIHSKLIKKSTIVQNDFIKNNYFKIVIDIYNKVIHIFIKKNYEEEYNKITSFAGINFYSEGEILIESHLGLWELNHSNNNIQLKISYPEKHLTKSIKFSLKGKRLIIDTNTDIKNTIYQDNKLSELLDSMIFTIFLDINFKKITSNFNNEEVILPNLTDNWEQLHNINNSTFFIEDIIEKIKLKISSHSIIKIQSTPNEYNAYGIMFKKNKYRKNNIEGRYVLELLN